MAALPALAKRAALVYNPVKVADADALRLLVSRSSSEAGWADPLFLETSIDDPGQGVTRRALDAGASVVLVAGGDGTVRAVAEAMNGTDIALAIVPSGTGNILARNLRLPLSETETMVRAAIVDGKVLPIDIGIALLERADGAEEQHAFVVMAGIGLDAAMIANTSAKLKKRVGWVAYVDGAARAVAGATPFQVMWQRAGGRLHSTTAQSMLFANCGTLTLGIGLMPDASITDGSLDLAVVQPSGRLGWLNVFRRIFVNSSPLSRTRLGRRVVDRQRNTSILYVKGEAFEAAVLEPTAVEFDGDEFGVATRLRCRVDAGGLLVVLPPGHQTDRL